LLLQKHCGYQIKDELIMATNKSSSGSVFSNGLRDEQGRTTGNPMKDVARQMNKENKAKGQKTEWFQSTGQSGNDPNLEYGDCAEYGDVFD
jgi:hypothetical protein